MTTEPMTPTDPIATPSVRDAAPARPLWQVILIRPVTMTVALLILEPIVASVFWPQSLDLQYILNTFTLTAPLALMALVLTLVIISGEIDLSPASSMALTACVFAAVLQAGVPFPLAVLICIGLGFLLGLFNAFLVVFLRLPSLTDQIFIKAQRIRSLQENEVRKVDEDESGEFIGIINYAVMALIQLELGIADQPDLTPDRALELYDAKVLETKNLMLAKNHDYGEAWREMRVSSLTDLILQKILRVKQIEDNKGLTIVSEGIAANYQDMINYAVFALILTGHAK